MSDLAFQTPTGELRPAAKEIDPVRKQIEEARAHRKKREPEWESCLAWASGNHWVVTERISRQLRRIEDVDPRYKGRELYTADRIGERRDAILGELASEDDRPELLTPLEDEAAEKYQAQMNRALGYGWEHEFEADEALAIADQFAVDLGVSAIRVLFDPTKGPPKESEVPFQNGQPIPRSQAVQLFGQGFPREDLSMQDVPEGRILWEPLSPWNLLVPPGIAHERDFHWEAIIRPVPLDKLVELFPAARGLKEDKDIASSLGMTSDAGIGDGGAGKLRGHKWLVSYFERCSSEHRNGRVFHFAGNELKFIGYEPELPWVGPDQVYRSGITYLHYQRVTGRFWSRGLVEKLKDGQRAINNIRTDQLEIIRRGRPYVLVPRGTEVRPKRTGIPLEIVPYDPGQGAPTPVAGIGPGQWMDSMVQSVESDLEHASGIQPQSLGDAPSNVPNYAYLALLKESDATKRQPTMRGRRRAITELVECSVDAMRRYWGHEKQITLAGEEDRADAEIFDATKIPPFFIVQVAKGGAKPRSQAARLKLVEDIYLAANNAGLVQMNPDAWVNWYRDSLEAGQPLDLPESEQNEQVEKAELENHRMWKGELVEPATYDPPAVHVPIHRSAQIEAEKAGEMQVWETIEKHIQWHVYIADLNAQRAAQEAAEAQAQLEGEQVEQEQAAATEQADAEQDRALELERARQQGRPK